MFKKIILLCVFLLCLTGCVNLQKGSYLPPDFADKDFKFGAEDIASTLADAYPPGQTILKMEQLTSLFHQALEDCLRAKGFIIYQTGDNMVYSDVLALSYTIDHVREENGFYVHVKLSDGIVFTRYYKAMSNGYLPGVPLWGTGKTDKGW